ncbi:MAG: hypothetical protein K6T77_06800 [candidate division WOR-3 bacterium]|jgi:hypothetical protein|nr:hypothetical protein [candidate division WOR-3 bacterium]MCR4424037.1 hypothetical protein [candidate division WOR-3 bacterium]MDH7519544.1 hypothetical protein [bacterium]
MDHLTRIVFLTPTITQSDYLSNTPQKRAGVKEYERPVAWLVYKLTGLTMAEIKNVEREAAK